MFLKEQLESMKGAFHLEKQKLDTVEIKLKEEIDALKLKSCQDDKKIKDLAKALLEKVRQNEYFPLPLTAGIVSFFCAKGVGVSDRTS
ncbi:hypothetical protein chiPu_0019831 [Chiloscyllium punctatum]|uniref:Uncharacterized protein n=1 Tax=Chiloscyllium punctatum TaxID=137246 RepID=A0A401RT85_CHIPU|nr:hypothetical protein [Chiloscyllium punctatum]